MSELQAEQGCLRRRLAGIVRSTQWSYAVFWGVCAAQPWVLEWRDGYYNGDIKTIKRTEATDVCPEQWGLQRSMQLRELYESLSAGGSSSQARRPSASLSPEDLTETEWYYLVCMSFTFTHGQCLPGRTLSTNTEVWLCNAHFADTTIFSRSILAKSACIQTIVCIPFKGGVLELGTTEIIPENQDFIKQLTSSSWELPISVCSEVTKSSSHNSEEEERQVPSDIVKDIIYTNQSENHNSRNTWSENCTQAQASTDCFVNDDDLIGVLADQNISEELKTCSHVCTSNGLSLSHQDVVASLMNEGMKGTSQIDSLEVMDKELDRETLVSLKSIDCSVTHSFGRNQVMDPSSKGDKTRYHPLHGLKASALEHGNTDDTHYKEILSIILRTPCRTNSISPFRDDRQSSSFMAWNNCLNSPYKSSGQRQEMLKKILSIVALFHSSKPSVLNDNNGLDNINPKLEQDFAGFSHVMSKRRRREQLNDKFAILKSLVPSVNKVDLASILEDTIDYVKELERRVEQLESGRDLKDYASTERKKHPDISEKTSDNYGSAGISNGRISCIKRKTCLNHEENQQHLILSKDCSADITVSVTEKEVEVEVSCPWREFLLLEIVEALSNVHLNADSLQSSNVDGILFLTIKSKLQGIVPLSAKMIKQALRRVVSKC